MTLEQRLQEAGYMANKIGIERGCECVAVNVTPDQLGKLTVFMGGNYRNFNIVVRHRTLNVSGGIASLSVWVELPITVTR